MADGDYWGSIYQSPVDDAEAALQNRHRRAERRRRAVPELFRHAEDHPKTTWTSSPSRCSDPSQGARGGQGCPAFFWHFSTHNRRGRHGACCRTVLYRDRGCAGHRPRNRRGAFWTKARMSVFADINAAKVQEVADANAARAAATGRKGRLTCRRGCDRPRPGPRHDCAYRGPLLAVWM